jgi:regulator of Ty1 transposition protein 103
LAVGGMPEKIVTSYQSLFDENFNEEMASSNCSTSVGILEKIEKGLNEASISGKQNSYNFEF